MVNLIKGKGLEERLNNKGYTFTEEGCNKRLLDQCLEEVVMEIVPLNGMTTVIMTREECIFAKKHTIIVCRVVNGEEMLCITTDMGKSIKIAL